MYGSAIHVHLTATIASDTGVSVPDQRGLPMTSRRSIRPVRAAAITLTAATIISAVTVPAFQGWTTDIVDASVNAGVTTGFAFAPDGRPSVAYSDTAKRDSLFFAVGTGTASPTAAQRQLVDSAMDISLVCLDYDNISGRPGIAYSTGDLRYASHDGLRWNIEILSRTGSPGDLAFDSAGSPGIAFVASNGKSTDVRVALRSGTGWTIEVVKSKAGVDSLGLAMAFDNNDAPAVAYSTGTAVYLARRGVAGWAITQIDSGPFNFGLQPDLGFDAAGNAALAYMSDPQGSPNRHLVYSVHDGVTVQRMVIDPTATRGASLAFDRGEPAIAYVAAGGLELRMARRSAGVWGIQSVETVTSSSVGLPALAFSPVSFEPGIGWQTASDVVLSRGLPQ